MHRFKTLPISFPANFNNFNVKNRFFQLNSSRIFTCFINFSRNLTSSSPQPPSPPISTPKKYPLEDITILAVEQFGAGPFGTVHLADLGAKIIKIEDPNVGGDISRHMPDPKPEIHLYFETFNRNKKSVALDLRNEAGKRVFHKMIPHVDAVYSNLRGDVPEKLGLTYSQLSHLNPKIVCVSLSGFGMTGPLQKEPAYDPILQGYGAWMQTTGDPDMPPVKTGPSLVDYAGGMVASTTLLAAIHSAKRDGIGMDCDLSLYDTALNFLGYLGTWALNTTPKEWKFEKRKGGGHPTVVPFQIVPTKDGWISVACAKEKFWNKLVHLLDSTWTSDSRFSSIQSRHENRDYVVPMIEKAFQNKTSQEWLKLLKENGIPCGPVHNLREAFQEPHLKSRNLIMEYSHPNGNVKQISTPVRVGKPKQERAPRLGEHTAEILTSMGFSEKELQEYRKLGAFG